VALQGGRRDGAVRAGSRPTRGSVAAGGAGHGEPGPVRRQVTGGSERSNSAHNGRTDVLWPRRVGWWAGGNQPTRWPPSPGRCCGPRSVLGCPGLSPCCHGRWWGGPTGFQGEPAAVHLTRRPRPLVRWRPGAFGGPDRAVARCARALTEDGRRDRGHCAPRKDGDSSRAPAWGRRSPSPSPCPAPPAPVGHSLDAAVPSPGGPRASPGTTCSSRAACWTAPGAGSRGPGTRAGPAGPAPRGPPGEVSALVPVPGADYPRADLLVARRAETEEGRHQPEDWR